MRKSYLFACVGIFLLLFAACGGGGGGNGSPAPPPGGDIAPTVPTGLTATPISAEQIDLSWNSSVDDSGLPAGYKVYRSGALIASVTGTSHSEKGLALNTTYCYAVSAYDGDGNESAACTPVCATTVDTWTPRTEGSIMRVTTVAYSGSLYVAGGNELEVLISTDGVTWTKKTSARLVDIIWDGTRFVGLGAPWNTIKTSTDGVNWTNVGSAPYELSSIAYSGTTYVAVGENGTIMTSSDLATWSSPDAGTTAWFSDVIWGGGQFVAVGSDWSAEVIITSPDGINWTTRFNEWGPNFLAVAWSGSLYVAANAGGLSYTSADGITWTQNSNQWLYDVAWSDKLNMFVGLVTGQSYTSTDGLNWASAGTIPSTWIPESIIWDGAQFVVTTEPGMVLTSPDAQEWTVRSMGADLWGVTWGGNKFVAVGSQGLVMTSTDGLDWTYDVVSYNIYFKDVAVSPTGTIAAGGEQSIYYTTDGVTWQQGTGSSSTTFGVCWSDLGFGAVGYSTWGDAFSSMSVDGASWTTTLNPGGDNTRFYDVIWDGSQFVAVGVGTVRTSPDGTTWTVSTSGLAGDLRSVAYSGSTYVAVGASGAVYTSADATTWTAQTSGTIITLNDVVWTGSEFVAVGKSSVVRTSSDGVVWANASPAKSYGNLPSVATNGTRHVAVGIRGTILTLH